GVPGGPVHLVAAGRQRPGHRGADPGRGARDERGAAHRRLRRGRRRPAAGPAPAVRGGEAVLVLIDAPSWPGKGARPPGGPGTAAPRTPRGAAQPYSRVTHRTGAGYRGPEKTRRPVPARPSPPRFPPTPPRPPQPTAFRSRSRTAAGRCAAPLPPLPQPGRQRAVHGSPPPTPVPAGRLDVAVIAAGDVAGFVDLGVIDRSRPRTCA